MESTWGGILKSILSHTILDTNFKENIFDRNVHQNIMECARTLFIPYHLIDRGQPWHKSIIPKTRVTQRTPDREHKEKYKKTEREERKRGATSYGHPGERRKHHTLPSTTACTLCILHIWRVWRATSYGRLDRRRERCQNHALPSTTAYYCILAILLT